MIWPTFLNWCKKSLQTGERWNLMFVGSMPAHSIQVAEDAASVEAALKKMLTAINQGQVDKFFAFNPDGDRSAAR